MKTAQDLREYLKVKNAEKTQIVDLWLEEEVFPNFSSSSCTFDAPDHLSLEEVESLLKIRGFDVVTMSSFENRYVTITLPPCGE